MLRWHTLGIPEKDSDMRCTLWAWWYRDMMSMHSHRWLATVNGKYQELTKKRIIILSFNCVFTRQGDTPLAFLKKTQKWDVRHELEYAFLSTVSDRERQHYTTKLVHDRCHMVTCLWAFNAITWLKCGVCGCYVMLSPHNNRPIIIKTAFGIPFPRLLWKHCCLLSIDFAVVVASFSNWAKF